MALQLDPRGNAISVHVLQKIKVETYNPSKWIKWIKGIHLDSKIPILSVWSDQDINFFDLSLMKEHTKPIHYYDKLCSGEDYITELMHNHKFNYFVIGTHLGHLSVWKLVQKRTLIHNY
jgi:hypothetical protein